MFDIPLPVHFITKKHLLETSNKRTKNVAIDKLLNLHA